MISTKFLAAVTLVLFTQAGLALHLVLVPQTISVNGHSVTLRVPAGMRLEFLAELDGARFPTFGPSNELIVGSNGSSVFRLPHPYTRAEVLVNIGRRSHSVAYRDSRLYVADAGGIYAGHYAGVATSLAPSDMIKIIDLPSTGHSSRTIVVGPGRALYVSIGISGNCSNEYLAGTSPDYPPAKRRGGVWQIDESGIAPVLVPYASGLRNPIGVAVNPMTDELWATNAGSDNLGYDQPREIFSRLSRGSWHGMPWFQFIDGAFKDGQCIDTTTAPRPASEAVPPSATFDARSTPQGIAFVTGNGLGDEFAGNALIAIHGSWATDPARGGGAATRRPPKVVMVRFAGAKPVSVEDVITGFQRPSGTRFARPSGTIMGRDGHFYFTSDKGEVQGLFRLRQRTDVAKAVISPILLLLGD